MLKTRRSRAFSASMVFVLIGFLPGCLDDFLDPFCPPQAAPAGVDDPNDPCD